MVWNCFAANASIDNCSEIVPRNFGLSFLHKLYDAHEPDTGIVWSKVKERHDTTVYVRMSVFSVGKLLKIDQIRTFNGMVHRPMSS